MDFELPKIDPDSERIEVLSALQFQKLNELWDNYPNRQVAHLHKLIGWTGMRPSEPLRLVWEDVDFEKKILTKRKTKSSKTLKLRINEKALEVLFAQRNLLDKSPKPMRHSPFVFPKTNGEMLQLSSYKRHFNAIREAAGIPKKYRPNYCLRDTIASMMLSDGATLDEVGYQLGHEPGSPMTRRYAQFIPDATSEYFLQEDKLGNWIEECCEEIPNYFTQTSKLFKSWSQWCEINNERKGSKNSLSRNLGERGYLRSQSSKSKARSRGFMGLKLLVDPSEPELEAIE